MPKPPISPTHKERCKSKLSSTEPSGLNLANADHDGFPRVRKVPPARILDAESMLRTLICGHGLQVAVKLQISKKISFLNVSSSDPSGLSRTNPTDSSH